MLYIRYRIDATNYVSGVAHATENVVSTEWHDDKAAAASECVSIAEAYPDDDDLTLAIHEYHIEADEAPSDGAWNALRTRQPICIVEEQTAREWAADREKGRETPTGAPPWAHPRGGE